TEDGRAHQLREQTGDLFSIPAQPELGFEAEPNLESEPNTEKGIAEEKTELVVSENPVDFYQLFISELQRLAKKPVTVDTLIESIGLHKSQVNEWLKRAVDDEMVQKLNRPVRYQIKNR